MRVTWAGAANTGANLTVRVSTARPVPGVSAATDNICVSAAAVNTTVQGCTVTTGKRGVNILGGTGHLIDQCTASACTLVGLNFDAGSGTISNSVAYNCPYVGIRSNDAAGTSTVTIHHCVVYVTGANGVSAGAFNTDRTGVTNYYHCVAVCETTGKIVRGFYIQSNGTVTLENCSAVGCGTGFYNNVATFTPTIVFDYNHYYGNTTALQDFTAGAHDVNTDPKFVSLATNDYHLQADSPLIDAGLAIAGINDGYLGDAPDIGRYEKA